MLVLVVKKFWGRKAFLPWNDIFSRDSKTTKTVGRHTVYRNKNLINFFLIVYAPLNKFSKKQSPNFKKKILDFDTTVD